MGQTNGLGDTSGDVYLLKLDSAGNYLWQKKYGGNNADAGFSIKLLNDGGFIIGGITYSFGPGYSSNYLIRTDSAGNEIWSRTYGIVDGFNGGCQAFPAKTGGYLMFGLWDTIADDGNGASYIARLDTSGNIKWMTFFDDSIGIDPARELENGNIVGVGYKYKPPGQGYFFGGYIVTLDSNGNQFWDKLLLYTGPGPDPVYVSSLIGEFYDIQPTRDGGFVLTGSVAYTVDSIAVDSFTNIQQIWLVKTDSVGCIDNYCGVEGINEIILQQQTNASIIPNPFTNYAILTINSPQYSGIKAIFQLFDMTGRMLNQKQFTINGSGVGQLMIEGSGMASGLYLYSLFANNEIIGRGKMVIQ